MLRRSGGAVLVTVGIVKANNIVLIAISWMRVAANGLKVPRHDR
jgi:hypothetical protein